MIEPGPAVVVPRVATQRLLLREIRRGDFAAYADNLTDPVATKFLAGVVDSRAAWRTFAAAAGQWMLNGAGWWMVELLETREAIGMVGAFFRETGPDLEIGWSLYRRFWGRGYAKEAAAAALAWGFDAHPGDRAIAHIAPENTASVRVSESIGMRFEGTVDFYGEPIGRYGRGR